MSKVLVSDTYLKNIANEIRTKNGTVTKYKPSEMASAIHEITPLETSYQVEINQSPNQTISVTYEIGNGGSSNKTFSIKFAPRITSGVVTADPGYVAGTLKLSDGTTPNFPITLTSDISFYATPAEELPYTYRDLTNYATYNIPEAGSITSIPQDNLEYLRSGLTTNSMESMFAGCINLQIIPNLGIHTTNCESVKSMCSGCTALKEVDLTWADTSNVKDFSRMFLSCAGLTTINGVIDMSSCETYTFMFYGCGALRGVKLKNLPPGVTPEKLNLTSGQYEIVS